ncbi:Uncharacterised protein [Stenotrophomonas maltophilia]|nr:Uncharacterised protein [Stenotrophomonas maltophilia]
MAVFPRSNCCSTSWFMVMPVGRPPAADAIAMASVLPRLSADMPRPSWRVP